jgi:hypothetical protein
MRIRIRNTVYQKVLGKSVKIKPPPPLLLTVLAYLMLTLRSPKGAAQRVSAHVVVLTVLSGLSWD